MQRMEIIALIHAAVAPGPASWADFGSGDGAFTLALRELLGPQGAITSIDQNSFRLNNQKQAFKNEFTFVDDYGTEFPPENITLVKADFTKQLEIPPQDGILMANSLHFIEDKPALLARVVHDYLKPGGTLLMVEYDTNEKNPYVPYPVTETDLRTIVRGVEGLGEPELIGTAPSRYWNRMYSLAARKQ